MKKIKFKKKYFAKKIFIKFCRILGYEIIDQSNFYVPTLDKNLDYNLSIPGKKSINIPLGEVKITRPVKNMDIIIRTCTSTGMLQQSKNRIFAKEKREYTFKSIKSILKSIHFVKKKIPSFIFKIYIIDSSSYEEDLLEIKKTIRHENDSKII